MQKYQIQIISFEEFLAQSQSLSPLEIVFSDLQAKTKISKTSLNLLAGHTFYIDIEKIIHLQVVLGEKIIKKHRKIAKGEIKVNKLPENQNLELICNLHHLEKNKKVFQIKLKITRQYEHEHFSMNSQTEEQVVSQFINTPLDHEKRRKKFKLLKQNEEIVYHEQPTGDIVNKMDNFKLDIDEALSKIMFTNEQNKVIAEMSYLKNPSDEDIKGISLKTNDTTNKLCVKIQTVQNEKLKSNITIPSQLSLNSTQILEFPVKDSEQEHRGKISMQVSKERRKIGSKKEPINKQSNPGNWKKEELLIPTEHIFNSQQNQKTQNQISPLASPKKKMDSTYEIWKLRQKTELGLKKKKKKQNHNSRLMSQEVYFPEIYPQKIQSSFETNQMYQRYERQKEREMEMEKQRQKQRERQRERQRRNLSIEKSYSLEHKNKNKTIQSSQPPQTNLSTLKTAKLNYKIVKIYNVKVKFYPSYFKRNEKNPEKQIYFGKSFQFYSNTRNIYRSDVAFGSYNLVWEFNDCQVQIDEFDNLICELNYEKEKRLIGELSVSFNQLKKTFYQGENFTGYLSFKTEPIATININFTLKQSKKKRIKPIIESNNFHRQDLMLEKQKYLHTSLRKKKQRQNLHQSMSGVDRQIYDLEGRKNYHLCQKQAEKFKLQKPKLNSPRKIRKRAYSDHFI